MKRRDLRSQEIERQMDAFITANPHIQALHQVAWLPYVKAALWDWGCILGSMYLAEESGNIFVYALACLLIASRQHAFLALSHDAAHYRISQRKWWNDCFSNCLFAYPILFDTDGYRRTHLRHHSDLNTERDPDWVRKVPLPQWQFPMSLGFFWRNVLPFVVWNGPKEWIYVMLHLARVLPLPQLGSREALTTVASRVAYYAVVCAGISYLSLWQEFVLYWAVPLLFVFPSLQRVRSVAEHFGLDHAHVLHETRTVLAPWYEAFLFGPRNLKYHLAHHLVPGVPYYNLPKLQVLLEESPVYRAHAHQNTSYLLPTLRPLYRDLFSEFESSSGEERKAA